MVANYLAILIVVFVVGRFLAYELSEEGRIARQQRREARRWRAP